MTGSNQHPPGAGTGHEPAEADRLSQAYWDDRYRSRTALWSGDPNPHLVTEADGLVPGSALDAGAGEGADAIWLARRGWTVTAVDISAVALERAAAHAAEAGSAIAGRIRWTRQDLFGLQPHERSYDLVTVHYLHLPSESRRVLLRRLAAAVANGGSLLIVGHHPSDLQTTIPRPQDPDLFFTGAEIASQLGEGWQVITDAVVPRTATDPDGRTVTVHDTVFRAIRTS